MVFVHWDFTYSNAERISTRRVVNNYDRNRARIFCGGGRRGGGGAPAAAFDATFCKACFENRVMMGANL